MKSFLGFVSTLALLSGLAVCACFIAASLAGKITPSASWDVVITVGLPLAAIGTIGVVLTGHLRAAIARLASAGSVHA